MKKRIISMALVLVFMMIFTSAAIADFDENLQTEYEGQYEDIPALNEIREIPWFSEMRITSSIDPFTAPREHWHTGSISLINDNEEYSFDDIAVNIRGRGNSTWWFGTEKRPLRLRFDEPRAMLDSGSAHRDWILLANHFDRSLLRNHTALHLGSLLCGLDFTPMSRFVHLYVNGRYMGVYQLTDERDLEPGRGTRLTANADPEISEYMLELDARVSGTPGRGVDWVQSTLINRRHYEIRFPGGGVRSDAHGDYVQNFLTQIYTAILDGDLLKLEQLVDIPSLIDFYLVQEFMKDPDSADLSVFMTIRGQGEYRRLFMGPIWDFDIAAGNYAFFDIQTHTGEFGNSPYGVSTAIRHDWYRYLMAIPEFAYMVASRWFEIRNAEIYQTIRNVEYLAERFSDDFERNFDRHQIMGTLVWEEPESIIAIETFVGQVEFLVNWLESRANWLDQHFEAVKISEPAIPLPIGIPTGSPVFVNGQEIKFRAYFIDGSNFFRPRDIAYVLRDTNARFDVIWDGGAVLLIHGENYTVIGGEMPPPGERNVVAVHSIFPFIIDGQQVSLRAYLIDGSNFVMLRELGEKMGFNVDWDSYTGRILICTGENS